MRFLRGIRSVAQPAARWRSLALTENRLIGPREASWATSHPHSCGTETVKPDDYIPSGVQSRSHGTGAGTADLPLIRMATQGSRHRQSPDGPAGDAPRHHYVCTTTGGSADAPSRGPAHQIVKLDNLSNRDLTQRQVATSATDFVL